MHICQHCIRSATAIISHTTTKILSRCKQDLCPGCTTPDCKCDDACWPGQSLNNTSDKDCACFAVLGKKRPNPNPFLQKKHQYRIICGLPLTKGYSKPCIYAKAPLAVSNARCLRKAGTPRVGLGGGGISIPSLFFFFFLLLLLPSLSTLTGLAQSFAQLTRICTNGSLAWDLVVHFGFLSLNAAANPGY